MSDKIKTEDIDVIGQAKDIKTLTQDEVNSLVGKTKKETQEKILRDLGVEDFTNAKEGLKLLREKQEAEKSEYQKLKDQIDLLNKEKNEVLLKAEMSEAKVIAISKGVNSEKIDKFLKVAQSYDGESLQDKIDIALNDFPEFLVKQAPANIGGQTGKQDVSEDEKMQAAMRKAMGIK